MHSLRTRVRPPHSHGGLLAMAASFGVIIAVPVTAWQMHGVQALHAVAPLPEYTYLIIMLGLLILPALAFVLWLVRHCQHTGWVAAAGAVYGFSMISFAQLAHLLHKPWLGSLQPQEHIMGVLAMTIFGALASLGALLVQRVVFYRTIEQDGTLCDRCGYPAARSHSTMCPECGHVCGATRTTFTDRLIARFAKRQRIILGTLLSVLILGMALAIWSDHDYRTFGESFADRHAWMGYHVYVDRAMDDGPPSMRVYVRLTQRPAWLPHELHIGIGYLPRGHPSGLNYIATGDPQIIMRVPMSKVRGVLRSGPPDHIIDQLREAAVDAQWVSMEWWYTSDRVVEVTWDDAKR